MDSRVAQNALNFILSDRFTFKGTDTLPLVEIITHLQKELDHGAEGNPQSGHTEDPVPRP